MPPTAFARVAATVRDGRRTRHILAILLRYGFGDILARLPLEGPLALGSRALRRSQLRTIKRFSRAERIRRAVEELGPVFVKLGQFLAERPDITPPDLVAELGRLRDDVLPMPFDVARSIVEKELGRPLLEIFADFGTDPVAAASIAQVHRAVLADGRPVAVKIQRLDTNTTIAADLAILRYLASLASGRLLPEDVFDPVSLIDELAQLLDRETDFRNEFRMLQRFASHFESDPTVKIPYAHRALSTEKVLTMEFVVGERQASPEVLATQGLDPKKLARIGAHAFLRMALEHGLFHADPHGGNVLFCPGNVVAFLDFGATGRLDAELRGQLLDLLVAVGLRDHVRAAELFLRIGHPVGTTNPRQLQGDIADFVDTYAGLPLKSVHVPALFADFFEVLRRNAIRFPSDLIVLARALVALDSQGKRLDPDFDLLVELHEPVASLIAQRTSPLAKARRLLSVSDQVGELLGELPQRLRRVLSLIERQELGVRLSHVGLEGLVREIDRASNRVAFSLIVAALIVGSAIVSNLSRGPSIWGYPAVGVLGFLLAGLLGLWLVLSILRGGKL